MKKIVPMNASLVPKEAKLVFMGVIFDIYQWPQKMFDGSTETFEMLKRPDTVSVIGVKEGKIVILKQTQPNNTTPYMGFPGGRAEKGETPLESAKREMLEETGMTFKNWKLLNVEQPVFKIEWFIYTFLATEFENQTSTNHDAGEKIEVMHLNFDEVVRSNDEPGQITADTLGGYRDLQGLIDAPEFEGREVDVNA